MKDPLHNMIKYIPKLINFTVLSCALKSSIKKICGRIAKLLLRRLLSYKNSSTHVFFFFLLNKERVGGVNQIVEHPYLDVTRIDPTRSKPYRSLNKLHSNEILSLHDLGYTTFLFLLTICLHISRLMFLSICIILLSSLFINI